MIARRLVLCSAALGLLCIIGCEAAEDEPRRRRRYSARCDNNLAESGEACDGTQLRSETCESQGLPSGVLRCQDDCSDFDLSQCGTLPSCGNGALEDLETCDGRWLNGESCATQGFQPGDLSCLRNCNGFDTEDCGPALTRCGDGVQEDGEACDRTDFGDATCESMGLGGGILSCSSDCLTLNTAGCTSTLSCGPGTTTPLCPNGFACDDDDDCASGHCGIDDTCSTPEDPCNNGQQDGNETGVDCGGNCPACTPPTPTNNTPVIESLEASGNMTQYYEVVISASVSDADGLGDLSGGLLQYADNEETIGPFEGSVGAYTYTLDWDDIPTTRLTFGSEGTTLALRAIFFDQDSDTAARIVSVTVRCHQGGESACSGECFDFMTDKDNCGGCNSPVYRFGECVNGFPQCPDNVPSLCGDTCTSLEWDEGNCGYCGYDCEVQAANYGSNVYTDCDAGACTFSLRSSTPQSCATICSQAGLSCAGDKRCRYYYSPYYTSAIYGGCGDYNCSEYTLPLDCDETPPESLRCPLGNRPVKDLDEVNCDCR